jgi:CheY-like chemotaxis protein
MPTIPCIDGEEAVLITMQRFLEHLGHRALTSSTGAQGLNLLRRCPDVQLVILDYPMEPMDGMAVAITIRKSFPIMPILLHSGNAHLPERLLSFVDAVVGKDSPLPELISSIDGLLKLYAYRLGTAGR